MQKENIFQTVFHLNTKSVDCVRTIVDVVWPCSRVEPQKAREKFSLVYVWVEPAIHLVSGQLQKKKLTSVSS